MFQAFTNPVWTVSSALKVSVASSTDTSVDGACDKIVFTNGLNESATLTFDAVLLSGFEEITMYLNIGRQLTELTEVLNIVVDGQTFGVSKPDRDGWRQVLIDCQTLGSATTIQFVSLLANQTVFVDLLGVRKFDPATVDTDIVDAIIDAVDLDYNVATTLAADAAAGDVSISLASSKYVFNSSRLRLTNQAAETEIVDLSNKGGALREPLTYDYATGDAVQVLCPTVGEDADGIEPDPVCGVNIVDIETNTGLNHAVDMLEDGSKIKFKLGEALIQVYIDCTSKLKVLELTRKFQRDNGSEFRIVLDGEAFDVYLDNSQFLDSTEAGNNPRMSFFYKVQPAPATVETLARITDITITVSPEGA